MNPNGIINPCADSLEMIFLRPVKQIARDETNGP